MKAILLLDSDGTLRRWQLLALRAASDNGLEIGLVARCLDHSSPPKRRRNLVYYGLAFTSRLRMRELSTSSYQSIVRDGTPEISFHSQWEGSWQRIPPNVAEKFSGFDVVIKFGMNLLRGADDLPVKHGVLSFHHGDPTQFRGRPAGYYEIALGSQTQGVIVQKLSDTLDGGTILAEAHSSVVPHSYARTLNNAYEASIPLLAKALKKLESEEGRLPSNLGTNYRLPSNSHAVRFAGSLTWRKVRRTIYGAFYQKDWLVAKLQLPPTLSGDVELNTGSLEAIGPPPGYAFAADPMPLSDAVAFIEVLNLRTGRGEIARWEHGVWRKIAIPIGGHASYPQVVTDGDHRYLFPEIASVASPTLFKLNGDGTEVIAQTVLAGLENLRLVDATLLSHKRVWYLFASHAKSASYRLDLWLADEISGPYREHPSSPICMDVRGARMAGPLSRINGTLLRFGQNGAGNYGSSVRAHRVDTLTPVEYSESEQAQIRCSDASGPHTFSVVGDSVWIDFHNDRFALFAGVRRLKAKLDQLRRA